MITNPTIPHTTGMQIESRFISLLALSTKINCRRHSKQPIIPPYKKNSKYPLCEYMYFPFTLIWPPLYGIPYPRNGEFFISDIAFFHITDLSR